MSRLRTTVRTTDDGKGWVLGHHQDCEPIIEHNKRLATLNDGYSPSKFLRRKASIPVGLLMQWLAEDKIDAAAYMQWPWREQQKYLRRKYGSIDYKHLRTARGSI